MLLNISTVHIFHLEKPHGFIVHFVGRARSWRGVQHHGHGPARCTATVARPVVLKRIQNDIKTYIGVIFSCNIL